MCRVALDGGMMVPGLVEGEVPSRLESGGQGEDDLCTCAAMHIAAGGKPLQQAIEQSPNPALSYASSLAGGISTCLL